MPIQLKRTTSTNPDFIALVANLDHYLEGKNGHTHDFYHQFNNIDVLTEVVIAYDNGQALACGAFKKHSEKAVEIKRMYVHIDARNRGLATLVLKELEQWASELTMEKCVLETGYNLTGAIYLYEKNGYVRTPNYEPYKGIETSICMEKKLLSNP